MAQVDKLNYLPLIFWFVFFFTIIYFLITVYIIPYFFIILKSRARLLKRLIAIIKKNTKAFVRFINIYTMKNRYLLARAIRIAILKYLS